jgi:hypothetical protein
MGRIESVFLMGNFYVDEKGRSEFAYYGECEI